MLVNVAFITLIERKILGLSQLRLGPNKTSFRGLLQPVSDAIKLFSKEFILNINSHKIVFFLSPILSLLLVLWLWQLNSLYAPSLRIELRVVVVIVILGLNRYPTIFRGWSSRRKYTLLGRIRGVSQSISYEIRLAFLLISVICIISTLNFLKALIIGWHTIYFALAPMIIGLIYISLVAETNRTPFDFAEGERELVSGFNTEYGGGGFALIFIAEYGRIYFLSGFISWLILGTLSLFYYVFTTLIIFIWVWFRSTYPRYRYDLLINLAWKRILPARLVFLVLSLIILIYIKI